MTSKEKGIISVKPVDTVGIKSMISKAATENLSDRKLVALLSEAEENFKWAAETGYTPELRRNFSLLSVLGVAFGLTNSWFGISASLVTGISSGGPLMIVYGIIIVACMHSAIAVTLAELASSMPNAGGQYYWTMKLAPKKYAPFLSYLCGSFAWAGSVFTSASVTISIATSLVGMYVLGSNDPTKTVKTWQVFITYELVNLFLFFFNVWERPLPMISNAALYTSLTSFIVITIVVLAKSSGHYQDASFVFSEFSNGTGWSSSGIAFIVGLINPTWSFSCLDAATHLSEEINNPERLVPIAIVGTVAIGFVTSFCYSISMFFCIRNLDDILNSTTGVPIMDIFHQALNSRAGAIVLEVLVLLTAIGCNISSHTWQARLCWSFSRDNGLLGSRYWSKINENTRMPVNAHFMSCCWCGIIGCIYMGSTTAYNAMVVGCIIFLLFSYSIPTVCLLIKGRDSIARGPFWMGKFGLFCNIILILWTIFTTVFYSFPMVMPVTAGNMNYVSAVIGVFGMYTVIYWFFRGRKKFITIDQRESHIPELVHQLSNEMEQIQTILSNKEVKA